MNVALHNHSAFVAAASPAFEAVSDLLHSGVEHGVFPGAVLLVARDGDVVYQNCVGVRALKNGKEELSGEMQPDTVFDIASLTALLVTSPLVMKLVEHGTLSLADKVARYIDGFSVFGKSNVSIAHLLTHTSGLAGWVPYFEELLRENSGARMGVLTSRGAREYIVNSIKRSQLKFEPGTRQLFSDSGLILLGHIVELLTGLSLDKLASRHIFHPLGMRNTSFIDLTMIRRRGIHPVRQLIAPTEECAWRKRILCGEVHDDNAWAMGGIAGHSGVFSTAHDLHLFASEMLRAYRGQSGFLCRDSVRILWGGVERHDEWSWQHGWDTPSRDNEMFGAGLGDRAVGACGFTGCSLWIEPDSGIEIILMSNRVHPGRSNKKIRSFRPSLHKLVLEALGRSN